MYASTRAMDNQEKKRIGQLIRTERLSHGLTQEDLAERVGVSRDHILRVEKGTAGLSMEFLGEVAKVFNYSLYGFLQLEVPKPKEISKQQLAENFARNFVTWRTSRALTLQEIANKTGLEYVTIRAYSAGIRFPNPKSLQAIAKVLGTDPETLLQTPNDEVQTNGQPSNAVDQAILRRIAEVEKDLRDLRDEVIKGFARLEALLNLKAK